MKLSFTKHKMKKPKIVVAALIITYVFVSVEIYYQPIDEMTMTKKWPLLTIWIEDATTSILYEWRRGQQTSEDTEG
jgi:hypothetical protein